MDWKDFFKQENITEFKTQYDLTQRSYIKMGGVAEYYLECLDERLLCLALSFANVNGLKLHVMGLGTNVCFADGVVKGLFLSLGLKEECSFGKDIMRVSASMSLTSVLAQAHKSGYVGFEFSSGIPGSVGGAVKMNAGTKSGEMKDILVNVKMATKDGIQMVNAKDLELRYRHSNIQDNQVILEASFLLKKATNEELMEKKKEVRRYIMERNEKQPVEMPTLGSTFKNPTGNFAARLLEECGFKGFRLKNIGFSDKHANFLINYGGASVSELQELIKKAKETVYEKTGVRLELEIKTIGFDA